LSIWPLNRPVGADDADLRCGLPQRFGARRTRYGKIGVCLDQNNTQEIADEASR